MYLGHLLTTLITIVHSLLLCYSIIFHFVPSTEMRPVSYRAMEFFIPFFTTPYVLL